MLDLMTLGASMGLQTELTKVREETGAAVHQEENVEATTTAGPIAQAANVVADALSAVECTVSAAASAMVPTSEMMSDVIENVSMEAPTVDLSLPTQRVAKK